MSRSDSLHDLRNSLLVFTALVVALSLVACGGGGAAPTSPPPAKASVQPTQPAQPPPPPASSPTAPAALPTAVPLPTVITPTATLSPTVAVSATATAVPPTRPAATPATPAVKPAATTGRLYYGVVTDAAPQFHSIWSAKTDGSGAVKLMDGAAWPAQAPNGKNLAFYQLGLGGKNAGLYVGDAYGASPMAAYLNAGVCCINWSNDSVWVVFAVSPKAAQPGGPIMMVKADGVYRNPTVVDLKVVGSGPAFSPDNRQIVYSGSMSGSSTLGLLVVAADGSGNSRQITRDDGGNAHWSPRGDKIVYQAKDASGHNQVFVVNVDGSGKKQLTSGKGNDGQPVWSRDGGTIFWRSDQNGTAWAIMAMNADGSNPRRILANVAPDPDLWGWETLSVGP